MKICVANVKYSPNLGDGLLSECLESRLKGLSRGVAQIEVMDLSLRNTYGVGGESRGWVLNLLSRLPPWIRPSITLIILGIIGLVKWRPAYYRTIKDSDVLIIGGGNLFSAHDANFPIKLYLLLSAANKEKVPVAIYAVGASKSGWRGACSYYVKRKLRESNLLYVSARDLNSKAALESIINKGSYCVRQVDIALDPGFMAKRVYTDCNVATPVSVKRIGVGVIAPSAVRYHSTCNITDRELLQWYEALVKGLIKEGFEVSLFTNGSPEDERFKIGLSGKFIGWGTLIMSRFPDPKALYCGLKSFDIVVAFRLHALIAAYAGGGDVVPLVWENKVKDVLKPLGVADSFVDVRRSDPQNVVDYIVERCKRNRRDQSQRIAIARQAEEDVKKLVESIANH